MLLLKGISNIKSKWEVRNGKLDNEFGCGNNLTSHLTNLASHFSPLTSFPRNWKLTRGFGLIEFMIVITVLETAIAVITASFLTFERNQRLKSAASMLKNDIRLVQNKALGGDKGVGGTCDTAFTNLLLVGWFVTITQNSSSYTLAGNCRSDTDITSSYPFGLKTVSLPKGVTIKSISLAGNVNILFQPLTGAATFHNGGVTPSFFIASGNFKSPIAGSSLTIEFALESDSSKKYQVVVQSSGEVNEQKL